MRLASARDPLPVGCSSEAARCMHLRTPVSFLSVKINATRHVLVCASRLRDASGLPLAQRMAADYQQIRVARPQPSCWRSMARRY